MSLILSPRHHTGAGGPSSAWLAAALLALAALAVGSGCTSTSEAKTPTVHVAGSPSGLDDGVQVDGTGEASGAPDTLRVQFAMTIKRDTVEAAVADDANLTSSVLAALKAAGVTEDRLQTQNYSISPQFTYNQGSLPQPDGYSVTNTVVAKVTDLAGAGRTIDAATKAGGNDLSLQGLAFSLEDDTGAVAVAREKAWIKAETKAMAYAKLSGHSLGPAQAVKESTTPEPYAVAMPAGDAGARAAASPTPVQPGRVSTSVTVEVRFPLR